MIETSFSDFVKGETFTVLIVMQVNVEVEDDVEDRINKQGVSLMRQPANEHPGN